MSLTSYRAAPPRVNPCIWAPACAGASFGLRLAALVSSPHDGYEPDELPGCSTPRQSVHLGPRLRGGIVRFFVSLRSSLALTTVMSLTSYRAAPPRDNRETGQAQEGRGGYVTRAWWIGKGSSGVFSQN